MDPLLAHSACRGIPSQCYVKHINNVRDEAVGNADRASRFYSEDRDAFLATVEASALLHDLGKVDPLNQSVLRCESIERLPVAHEDAGVAELLRVEQFESAILVAAHHAGLFSAEEEAKKPEKHYFRNRNPDRRTPCGRLVADYVDEPGRLDDYRAAHVSAGCETVSQRLLDDRQPCGFTRRLALSCLVDADHGDTAQHYGGEVETPQIDTRWAERAAVLQRYVDGLPGGKEKREKRRNELRRRVFEACRDAPVEPAMRACDAPVGSGKTTAVMAHLLRVAAEKSLRHIFVVLPYTNIITQSVEVYRKALVLEGERPEDIVAEHHHRADFEDIELRQLATLWKAPIIVTTAVQFFETLGSHHPSRLRKLHELPGSAVFVDETHAAIPSHLWPQMWRWLGTWTRNWGGHIVFASGSLARFWEIDEYRELIRNGSAELPPVPELVTDDALNSELQQAEHARIPYRRRPIDAHALDCEGLIDFVMKYDGPRLVIVNTIQTAAVIARAMRDRDLDVLHLSTALAPAHRDLVVERVRLRLREKKRIKDWTLVATSCIEAGMDFSFHVGFRERASTASLLQIAGRVRRGDEDEYQGAAVWDLLLCDDRFRHNRSLRVAQQSLNRISDNELNSLDPSELATRAMRQEWTCGAEGAARKLTKAEAGMEYPDVARRCRVIEDDTRFVVIEPGLARVILNFGKVSKPELLRYSVQMRVARIRDLGLETIGRGEELYTWGAHRYDPDFLGYMDGLLDIERFQRDAGAVI